MTMEMTRTGTATVPVEAAPTLAAVAVVVARRTLADGVVLRWQEMDDPSRGVDVRVDLSDDPTFAELVASLVSAEPADIDSGRVDAVVRVQLDRSGDPVEGPCVDHVTGAESPREAARVVAAVRTVAAAGTREPGRPVSRLPLVDPDHEDELRNLGTAEPTGTFVGTVQGLVTHRTRRHPHATAVVQGGQALSYQALEERSDLVAAGLLASGVRTGQVVAVLMPRSPDLVAVLLGILKAGCAYLALEPADPPARSAALLADSGSELLVTDGAPLPDAPSALSTVTPAALSDLGASRPVPAPPAIHPDDLAYVSYTSGSTGEPRGVAVTHRALSRLVARPRWIECSTEDTFLLLSPVAFDASTFEIWMPLTHGARLAVAPPGAVAIDDLAETIVAEQVTVLWLSAGLFHNMVTGRIDALSGLRHLVAGGDTVSPSHVERVLLACPNLTFSNGYGPTENTTFTACWTARSAPDGDTVPIGRPVPGTQVAILDPDLLPVPVGVCGELYTTGDGLARGYLGRPGATADRFLPAVFGTGGAGERMYRTGDLARWRSDGDVEFLGRADRQVKIQGYRVEPGYVETRLAALRAVAEAVVVVESGPNGDKRLVGHVVLDDGAVPSTGTGIREQLRLAVPSYMVPAAVLVRPELPVNRNGKVDRAALRTATRMPRNVPSEPIAARTPLEHTLVEVWGELLDVEPIGVEDDFFDLGGHSLLVAELLEVLHSRLQLEVPARVVYLQPTIAELAAEIGRLS